jgi:hypothetical protein
VLGTRDIEMVGNVKRGADREIRPPPLKERAMVLYDARAPEEGLEPPTR